MKLAAALDAAGKRAVVDADFDYASLTVDPLLSVSTLPVGYADVSSPRNWLEHGAVVGLAAAQIRDEILAFTSQWATLSTDDRKAMVEVFAYPATTTTAELDALYSSAEREAFRSQIASVIASDAATQRVVDSLKSADASTSATLSDAMQQLGRHTLTVAGDVLTVSGMPARKYLRISAYLIPSGGDIDAGIRFNGESTNYSDRLNENASETQASFRSGVRLQPGSYNERYFINLDIINITNQEKLVTGFVLRDGGVGAGGIPTRGLIGGKWPNTTASISRVDIVQNLANRDFAAGSELTVYGTD